MLRNTFVHLPGIGPRRERALWEQGILDWDGFLARYGERPPRGRILDSNAELVSHSVEALARGDAGFFKPFLPPSEAWRLYTEFADRAVFLDIETTGLSGAFHDVTVIGALGNGELSLFINGINLEQFPSYIASSRSWSASTAASSTCPSCALTSPRPGLTRRISICGLSWPRWATRGG